MDNKFNQYFGEFIDQHAAASSEIDAMNVDSELHQIEREIDRYKSTLRNCRDKYENIETEICDVRQLQRKARFILENVRSEEEVLHESFRNLRLNYETSVRRSDGYDETIRAKISELTTQRKKLLEELVQLRRKADDDGKKLARVKAMITEQEKKNLIQLRKLKEISESAVSSISPDVKKRINIVLGHRETSEGDGAIHYMIE